MTTTILTLAAPVAVAAALDDPALVPPGPPPSLAPGATAGLRATMARFSAGRVHARRRAAVEAAVAPLALDRLRAAAGTRTAARLTGGPVDAVADLAFAVPTEALLELLGAGGERGLVADVAAVAAVIGRGVPSGPAADGAAARLRRRFPVAVVALLHQAHDATGAALLATLTGRPGPPLVTRRVATAATTVGGAPVAAGTEVALDLTAAGLGFGVGPHHCPGRAVAGAVVAGAMTALATHRYAVVAERVRYDGDRPVHVPLAPAP